MGDFRFGVFGVGPHLVGIPAEQVHEMFVLAEVHRPPGIPAFQRGVARLRGAALPAIDLRVCLGHPSAESEIEALLQLLHDREKDHRAWLGELEASVAEGRAFTLATDPRRCKFGVWYYAFKTDDAVLRSQLAAFEEPHAAIHALAGRVETLKRDGQAAEAQRLIAEARQGLLGELITIFDRTRRVVREQHKEIGVLVELGRRSVVLVVDRADAVADLTPVAEADDPLHSGALRIDLVSRLARWKGASQPVLVLDLAAVTALAAA